MISAREACQAGTRPASTPTITVTARPIPTIPREGTKAMVIPSVPAAKLLQVRMISAVPIPASPPSKLSSTLSHNTRPKMRGPEKPSVCRTACSRIRSWTAMTVVVPTSASTSPTQANPRYLAKPINSASLVEALQAAGSTQGHPSAPREPDWALDRQQFLNRIGYDKELLTEIVTLFGEDAPPKLKQLKSALETGDSQALKQAAHALKGMMGNFAANEAYATAFQLETMGRTGRWDHARETLERLEQQVKLVQKNLAALSAEVAP